MKARILLVSIALAAAAGLGCQVQGGVGAGASGPSSPPPPPPPGPSGGGGGGAAGAGSAAGGAPAAGSADCPNPANHCLSDGVYLIGKKGLENRAYVYLAPARPKTAVDGAGEAMFFNLKSSKDQSTPWHYATRPATNEDLVVGKTVFMIHHRDGDIYRAPRTRQEATGDRWWMARISSVAPVASNNYVIVTGGYKIAVDALRVADHVEDKLASVDLVSGEDAHFLTPNHYIIANKGLNRKYVYTSIGAPIKPPSASTKGDGEFLSLKSGKIMWTKHNWATRPAQKGDLRVGKQVFMIHHRNGDVYRAPKDRNEALSSRWWTAKITDASQLYKGQVTVAGSYLIDVSGIRVAR